MLSACLLRLQGCRQGGVSGRRVLTTCLEMARATAGNEWLDAWKRTWTDEEVGQQKQYESGDVESEVERLRGMVVGLSGPSSGPPPWDRLPFLFMSLWHGCCMVLDQPSSSHTTAPQDGQRPTVRPLVGLAVDWLSSSIGQAY